MAFEIIKLTYLLTVVLSLDRTVTVALRLYTAHATMTCTRLMTQVPSD